MMGDDSDGDGIGSISSNSTAISDERGQHDALTLLRERALLGERWPRDAHPA